MNARTLSIAAIAAAGALSSGLAFGQTRTYNFGDVAAPGACTGTYSTNGSGIYGNTIDCAESPSGTLNTLDVNAWSSDGSSSTFRTAGLNQWGSGSGFGAYNRTETTSATSPSHALDNSTPGVDLLLLNFVGGIGPQAITSVTLGWAGGDADFQVLRWTGGGSVTSIAGKSASTLLSEGWALMGNVQNGAGLGDTNQTFSGFNAGELTSNSWIISTYNTTFGGSGATSGADAIKVLGITAKTIGGGSSTVSAPGTLALAGLGLLGAGFMRRRRA